MSNYKVTAGDNSTDLGLVGYAKTILGAKRVGRKVVRDSLPGGEGKYKVFDDEGREVMRGERSIRTDFKWIEFA